MKYEFDKYIDRRNTGSCKWEACPKSLLDENCIPMTVADMEFETAPQIKSALMRAAEHGICGYTEVDDTYISALSDFMKRRHGLTFERKNLLCTTGIVPAFGIIIRALTNEGDGIIVQPPVYTPFFNAIKGNGRRVIENPLILNDDRYEMDFAGLEKCCNKGAKMLMLCSPHNPVGRVWTRDELMQVGEICKRHNVIILCDEIHGDIVYPGSKHTSLATLPGMKDSVITCTAMSKTFNLAGLMHSNVFVFNGEILEKLSEQVKKEGSDCIPYFARVAAISAFSECDDWIDELLVYLENNMKLCHDFIKNELPMLECTKAEGTYLLWLDCRELGMSDSELSAFFTEKAKIFANPGVMFGHGGEGFMRLNIALPKEKLFQALLRLKHAIKEIEK